MTCPSSCRNCLQPDCAACATEAMERAVYDALDDFRPLTIPELKLCLGLDTRLLVAIITTLLAEASVVITDVGCGLYHVPAFLRADLFNREVA